MKSESREKLVEKAKQLFNIFSNLGLFKTISQANNFYDEPRFFFYGSLLQDKNNKFNFKNFEIDTSGASFESAELALLKCLSEAVERVSLYNYPRHKIIFSSFAKFGKKALDPDLYSCHHKNSLKNTKLGWVEGRSLFNEDKIWLTAQLVFLTFRLDYKEPVLAPSISTGAAAHFSKKQALLKGIYEVVERDAAMCAYLAKIPLPRVDLSALKNPRIKNIVANCQRYRLKPYVFEATTDLNIPAYIAVIEDISGFLPEVCVASNAGFNREQAIIGSILEALTIRPWIRQQLLLGGNKALSKSAKEVVTKADRVLFWAKRGMKKRLLFWLQRKPTIKKITSVNYSAHTALKKALLQLQARRLPAFYIDLTPEVFKPTGIYVTKVIIPKLQPLYLNEYIDKVIDKKRIAEVAKHFNSQLGPINKLLHPLP